MSVRLAMQPNLAVNAQLVLTSQLLRVATAELEPLLRRELQENPALELCMPPGAADPWRPAHVSRRHMWGSDEDRFEQMAAAVSPLAHLESQLRMLATEHVEVAVCLLHRLDEHGYLRSDVPQLAAQLALPEEQVAQALRALQQLEPPGIGARNLRECLLLQCAYLAEAGTMNGAARRIIEDCWDDVGAQRWDAIARKLRLSAAEVGEARAFMRQRLYPYPLLLLPDDGFQPVHRHPDLLIHRQQGPGAARYVLELPGETAMTLRLSDAFLSAAGDGGDITMSEAAWIEEHVNRARLFIHALAQRWRTLRRIGAFLIDNQREFLEHGALYLKPATRCSAAGVLNLHPSTIGRAVNGKVVQLPDGGLMDMADFFDSSFAAKAAIRHLLQLAEKPLSDKDLALRLARQGIPLARRTITKYRQQMGIPSSHCRKEEAGAF